MILLPTLPANNAEKPVKSAGSAGPDGAFAAILAGEAESDTSEGGKKLPEGGKKLPAELPLALQVVRKALVRDHAKLPEVAGETPDADGEPQEPAADGEQAESAPKGVEILDVIAVAIEIPIKLEPVPVAEGAPDKQAPDRAPVRKGPVLALVVPGKVPVAEDTPETGPGTTEAKPVRRIPVQAAPTLLAALAKQGEAATRRGPGQRGAEPAIAPEQAIAAAAETASVVSLETRTAKAPRIQPRRAVTLELVKGAKTAATADRPVARVLPIGTVFTPAQPIASDAAAPTQGARPVSEVTAPAQIVRPHEFAALVDRLVEARESMRPGNANLTVMHADFGRVSLHFGQESGNLTVSLANNDPGFVPAVNAAVAADANSGDTGFQGSRREDSGQSASSRTEDSNTGERGPGRESAERAVREHRIKPQPHLAGRSDRKPRGGIFA